MLTWSAIPLDIRILAVALAVCTLAVACFAVAELQRFTSPRPAARHRRRFTAAEARAELGQYAATAGWALLGWAAIAADGMASARRRIVQIGA